MLILLIITVMTVNAFSIFFKLSGRISSIMLIITMLIVMGFVSTTIPDYFNYEAAYTQFGSDLFEPGYTALSTACLKLGLSYAQFRIVTAGLGLGLIFITLIRYKVSISKILFLYMFFPFLFDVVQVRNFLMISIVLLGSSFINDSKRSYIIFAVFVIFAAQFHSLAYFYLLVIPMLLIEKSKKIYVLFFLMVGLVSLFSLMPIGKTWIAEFLSGLNLTSFGEVDKISGYLSKQTNFGLIPPVFCTLFNLIFTLISKKLVVKSDDYEQSDLLLIKITQAFSAAACVMIPLYTINLEFYRIVRNIFLLVFMVYVVTNKRVKNKKVLLKYNFIFLIYLISITIVFFVINDRIQTTVIPVLMYNTLLN